MDYELFKRAIETLEDNSFINKDVLEVQIEYYHDTKEFDDTQYSELKNLLNPVEITTI